jgi:broad specificity phosphatase PhoE
MAGTTDILEPDVDQQEPQPAPPPSGGPGQQPPVKTPAPNYGLKDEDKQKIAQIITKMQQAGEPDTNIKSVVKRFIEINTAPPPSPVDKGIRQTTQNLNQPLQFNGTFQPDLEGEKQGLYLNDPDYQAQKKEFVSRIATDDKGVLLYPQQDDKGNWSNYYTKQPIPNFDPHSMQGKILQVPNTSAAMAATGGKRFITPTYNWDTNSYDFPGVQTPGVPTEQTLPQATVYGTKNPPSTANDGNQPAPIQKILQESDKQGGQFRDVLKEHPELSGDVVKTLNKFGPEYAQSLDAGSQGMSNVLQKTVEDKYNLNQPLPKNVDPDILNGHLNVVNNFEKNRNEFEGQQQELQHQADLLTDRAKRTGTPVSQEDADRLAQKAAQNLQRWNAYTKTVNFSQNYLNQPEVKNYLTEFQKRQQGIGLMDEIRQRSFPGDTNAQVKQDEYDRKAVEGNTGVLDYLKTAAGSAGKGIANIGEGAMRLWSYTQPTIDPSVMSTVERLNNNAQQFLSSNLPAISQEAQKQISEKGGGLSLLANDISSTIGGFAPYIVPGLAEEAGIAKAGTFATALAESLPTVRKEAESAGLTGSAYNTYLAAKPLVNAAFMTLLPNIKFAKGFEKDVAESVVNGEFNNPKKFLLNLASKAVKDPNDVAHLQAMLTGTNLGNAVVNQVTNGLQAKEDLQRGISRQNGLSTDVSGAFDPRQTAVMALAAKALEAVPTLKNALGDYQAGKDVAETYDHIQNNLVELAAQNSKAVSAQVDAMLKKDPGNIYAQHLKNTLEDFTDAQLRMPQGLKPEQKAALFDVQKQISQVQRQMAYADPVYKPHLQKNIDELTKQIPELLKDPKKANDYLQDSHNDLIETINSPKTEANGKTTENAQAQGGQEIEKPEGAADAGQVVTAPSIEATDAYKTLNYGRHKGQEESQTAKDEIKDDILNDRPVGGDGEKLSQVIDRVIPAFQKSLNEDPHNTTIVTHSSVIKALHVWEEMGRPDVSEIKGDKLKEFAQRYVDMKPEAEGKVHTFTGDNGNDIKVVRHGETEDNKMSEFREDNTQLTDKGQAQAAKAGDNLIKETGGNIPKLISSDMPRTLHTSEIIKQKLQDNVPLRVERPAQEISRPEGSGENIPGSGERIRSGQQGNEPAGEGGEPGTEKENSGQKGPGEPDKTDELPFIEEASDNELTSTRNAVAKQKIEEAGLKEPMKEAAREFSSVWKDAQSKLAKGFDIEKLIKSLDNKPRAVTDLENAMILFHQNVKESQLDAANKDIADAIDKKKPEELADAVERRAKLLDDLQTIYNVDKAIGRETARGLNARKMMADRRFSLVNMQMEKRAAKGGDPLSDAEMKELQKQHDDIKAAKEEVDARVAELEKENAELRAKQAISGNKGGRTRKTKEQFKEERKDIVQKMRADLLRAAKGGEGLTSSVPGAAQLKAVAPHIRDLVKSFIEEGVDKLEDITKNIMDILKPDIPDLEERHVHDLIAGAYNEPQPAKEPSTYQKVKEEAGAQKYRATDPKLMKVQADYERAKDKFAQGLKVDQRKARTGFEKTQDAFLKYERAAKLSNPITLGKLVMAALTRLATTPAESAVGAAYSKLLPGIAKKAPGEAGANVAALAKGYKAAFMRGLDDAATVSKGGKTDIEAIYGKKGQLPPEALDFFGQLHSAIKAPVKRFAFERSFQKRLANNIKNGATIDGMTEARIAMEAYKDAERSIFMQDNPISKGWTNAMAAMERSGPQGELAATIGRWLLPFVKVPTNILGETISHVAGPEIALTQIISKSLGKGLKDLSQDEAESIMRNLKKGTIGHVALMAGYLNPSVFGGYYQKGEKRDEKDVKVGDMKVLGVNIPAWALEAPIFQAMQLGATVRRIKDTMVKGQAKGLGEGIWGGALGLMSHEPLIDEPSRLAGMMASPTERQYFLGELAKSTLVPAALEYAAKVTDPADTRSTGEKLLEPENKRAPETIGEHVESAIPGLRENTPIKKVKPTGHHQRQHR